MARKRDAPEGKPPKVQAVAEAIAGKTDTGAQRSVWVFPSENPKIHIDPRNFYQRVYLPKVKKIGLAGVTWHTLQQTFPSRLAVTARHSHGSGRGVSIMGGSFDA